MRVVSHQQWHAIVRPSEVELRLPEPDEDQDCYVLVCVEPSGSSVRVTLDRARALNLAEDLLQTLGQRREVIDG